MITKADPQALSTPGRGSQSLTCVLLPKPTSAFSERPARFRTQVTIRSFPLRQRRIQNSTGGFIVNFTAMRTLLTSGGVSYLSQTSAYI